MEQPSDEIDDLPLLLVNQLNPRERRTQAGQVRDHWRSEMDPSPTVRERRVMSSHRVQAEARRRGRQLTFHTYLRPIIILAGVAMLF